MNGAGPAKPWAGRFSQGMDASVEAYTASIEADARLLEYDIAGSIAHARMLGRQGIISRKDADAIVRGLRELQADHQRGAFKLAPGLEDVHMNVEAALTKRIGAVAGKLHTARSRNDQVATDFRMYVKDACRRTLDGIANMIDAMLDLAEQNKTAVVPGYTHLQRAQPVLFAHHLLAYVEMLLRDAARFRAAHDLMDESPLGSGALAGSPYPLDREGVADELGFARISRNSLDAVSDRDFVVDYLAAAALCMVHISRLAEDLVLWSSAEFAYIRMPDAFATGSSIMPQKKNPDVAELARGRSGRAVGALVSMLTTLKGLPLSYNRDLQEDKPTLFDSEHTLLSTLSVMSAMLPRIEVDAPRTRKAAVGNFALATDLADYLVRKGLPFREAHQAVGKLVAYAESQKNDLGRLSLAELRRFSPLFGEDARGINVMTSIRSRDVPGGTAPRQVASALRQARRRADKIRMSTAPSKRRPRDG